MKVKTSELTGMALDWAVAKALGILRSDIIQMYAGGMYAEGLLPVGYCPVSESVFDIPLHQMKYSTDWSQFGQTIEREKISIIRCDDDYEKDAQGFTTSKRIPVWAAVIGDCHSISVTYGSEGDHCGDYYEVDCDAIVGSTPLIAACRCFVTKKLGTYIEISDELLK